MEPDQENINIAHIAAACPATQTSARERGSTHPTCAATMTSGAPSCPLHTKRIIVSAAAACRISDTACRGPTRPAGLRHPVSPKAAPNSAKQINHRMYGGACQSAGCCASSTSSGSPVSPHVRNPAYRRSFAVSVVISSSFYASASRLGQVPEVISRSDDLWHCILEALVAYRLRRALSLVGASMQRREPMRSVMTAAVLAAALACPCLNHALRVAAAPSDQIAQSTK